MNKVYVLFFCVLLLAACGPNDRPQGNIPHADTLKIADTVRMIVGDSMESKVDSDENYHVYYVAIADTGLDYYMLDARMYALSKSWRLNIDTEGRHYDKQKDLIALPDDADDDMYAGDYFPRRFSSPNLSIEYLYVFMDHVGRKTMALVSGVFETKNNADSAVLVQRKLAPGVFVVKTTMYVGCMH